MRQDNTTSPLVAIVGPTGSGKSDLSIRLAEEFSGEIVNCDSLQLYRHLDIGTAKVPVAERRGIPHHLLDLLDPDQVYTAGEYARTARPVLADIAGRGKLPLVVGGTGFYLKALLEGLFSGPQRDAGLRARLIRREQSHPGWMHRLLERFDPPSAGRIAEADVQKLTRAVEVLLLTRRPLSTWFDEGRDSLEGFRVLKLGIDPPRAALYERINERSRRMFESGLLDEVRAALSLGFPPDSKAFEAYGYRQAVQLLRSEISQSEALLSTQQGTRQYAKRQWTWFRRDPEVIWIRGFGADPQVQEEALCKVREFLEIT